MNETRYKKGSLRFRFNEDFIQHRPTQLSDKTSWKYPNYDYICNYALEQHCYQQENRCWVMKNACFLQRYLHAQNKNFLVWFFLQGRRDVKRRCHQNMPTLLNTQHPSSFYFAFYELLLWNIEMAKSQIYQISFW